MQFLCHDNDSIPFEGRKMGKLMTQLNWTFSHNFMNSLENKSQICILPINIEINSRSAGSVAPIDCANLPRIVSAAIFYELIFCKKNSGKRNSYIFFRNALTVRFELKKLKIILELWYHSSDSLKSSISVIEFWLQKHHVFFC